MIFRRIIYAVLLILSVAVFILTDNNIALFFGVLLSVLPIFSLISLIIAAKRIQVKFGASSSCSRGKALQIDLRLGLSPRFLAGSAKITLEFANTTFHKTEKKTFINKDLSFLPFIYDYISENSGRVCVRIKEIKLLDWFGVCCWRVSSSKYAESIVSPVLSDNLIVLFEARSGSSVAGENVLPKRGNDRTEIFDVRDYIPGDSPKSVHWKLSGKFDTLKTKEYGATDDSRIIILVDMSRNKCGCFADDSQLNGVLDVAISLSGALKDEGFVHSVGWFGDGEFCRSDVSNGDTFVQMVSALMSIKVKEDDAETLFYFSRVSDRYSFAKVIFISPFVDANEWKNFNISDITAITVGEGTGQYYEGGVKVINVPCEGFQSVLSAYEL